MLMVVALLQSLFVINDPAAIVATTDSIPTSCFGVCDGTANVTASGGTGTLSIQWDAATGNQTGPTATGLCPGTYTATITDMNGCVLIVNAIVTQPDGMTFTVGGIDQSCFGICDGTVGVEVMGGTAPWTYQWFNGTTPINPSNMDTLTGLCAGTYFVTVTDASGCMQSSTPVTINEAYRGYCHHY